MKQWVVKRLVLLILCGCMVLVALAAIAPAKIAHASSCASVSYTLGYTWHIGDADYASTCSGTPIKLTYQSDGNFVLYIGGVARWATNTSSMFGYAPKNVQFQNDGNLVVTDYIVLSPLGSSIPVWSSGTGGKGAAYLSLQQDGNLVIYTAAGKALWASNTCCY